MHGWAIPQDSRMVYQIWENKKQVKICFNLPNNENMLCFDKLTGEHNNVKTLLFFWFCGNISLGLI